MKECLGRYLLGDMGLSYTKSINRNGCEVVGMKLYPLTMVHAIKEDVDDIEPLIQVKIMGDDYPFNYSHGRTMRNSQSTFQMKLKAHYKKGNTIITEFVDSRDIVYKHYVCYHKKSKSVEISCEIINQSQDVITLEMLSSFTLGSITPFVEGIAKEKLIIHQIKSTWANEGRLVSSHIEDFQLEPSWKPSGANCIRYGQIGSMPNREYFPFVGIEDIQNNVCWGVQLEIGSSWQIEAYRKDNKLSLSGGIADREFGHWLKEIQPSDSFMTPRAIVSTCVGDIDILTQRLTQHIQQQSTIHNDEKDLPIIFNEFCTTWGNPSEKKIQEMLDLLENIGIGYFVIDCGWYKKSIENNNSWNIQHGDWQFNQDLFPHGIKSLVNDIHKRHMKAGIWFEFEGCGRESDLFHQTNLLYKRDGYPITVGNRRFINMLSSEGIKYLDKHVLDFIQNNDIDYLKVDYNANLGLGPEGSKSLGVMLYDSVLSTIQYFKKLKETCPHLIIENCSAGGHRLCEPFLSVSDMSSFSDAHESLNIPLVAANMHRMIPVYQSQIWAVLQPEMSESLLRYKLSSTFLGRMCLSGNIIDLDKKQIHIVEEAIIFYRLIKEIILHGNTKIISHTGLSYYQPEGYQIVKREVNNEMVIIVHTFENSPSKIDIGIDGYQIIQCFKEERISVEVKNNKIEMNKVNDFDGIGIYLEKV
ncbi:MAG: alpha-galactosidase [Coprobacillus sp.]